MCIGDPEFKTVSLYNSLCSSFDEAKLLAHKRAQTWGGAWHIRLFPCGKFGVVGAHVTRRVDALKQSRIVWGVYSPCVNEPVYDYDGMECGGN